MNIREEYEEVVRHLGKFQGERPYVPYFWDIYLNGGADHDHGRTLEFTVTEEDARVFPDLLTVGQSVFLLETWDGFVCETDGPGSDGYESCENDPYWPDQGEDSEPEGEDKPDFCPTCNEAMDMDCTGSPRCPFCDPPCPGCSDGAEVGGSKDDEDSEPDEADEPQEEDYVTSDHHTFYREGSRHRGPVVVVPEDEDYGPYLRAHSEKESYFPDAWFIDDHGGVQRLDY